MTNEKKKNIPCPFMLEGTHCLKWAWQETLDSSVSDRRSHVLKHADFGLCCFLQRSARLCGWELETAQSELWVASFWWTSSKEEIHIFLPRLCWSRCVRICFPAISRCYSETPMCLTSCGHKTLSKIASSKALFSFSFFQSPEIIKRFMGGIIKSKQHFIPAHKFLEQSLSPIHLNT